MSAGSFSTLKLNLMLTHGIPPDVHGGVHIFLSPHTIASVPSLLEHANAYRSCLLASVRRHKAFRIVRVTGAAFASPRTNYYCAPLFFHTHYWYKVSMFKLSGVYQNMSTTVLLYCLVGPFSPSDLCLYKCKESSVHGTISSVVYQNIISSVLLLYRGPVSPRLVSVHV